MFTEHSLCPLNTHYVPGVQFMSYSTVNVLRVQFMSSKYCLCPEYTLCSQSIVYVL